jgi:hypothetical protein
MIASTAKALKNRKKHENQNRKQQENKMKGLDKKGEGMSEKKNQAMNASGQLEKKGEEKKSKGKSKGCGIGKGMGKSNVSGNSNGGNVEGNLGLVLTDPRIGVEANYTGPKWNSAFTYESSVYSERVKVAVLVDATTWKGTRVGILCKLQVFMDLDSFSTTQYNLFLPSLKVTETYADRVFIVEAVGHLLSVQIIMNKVAFVVGGNLDHAEHLRHPDRDGISAILRGALCSPSDYLRLEQSRLGAERCREIDQHRAIALAERRRSKGKAK